MAERRGRNGYPCSRGPKAQLISDDDECRQICEVAAVHS
jgi:hypothetical protein